MRKRNVVYMKNGKSIEISKEKYDALVILLTQKNCPQFVNIDGNIISISAISYCSVEVGGREPW